MNSSRNISWPRRYRWGLVTALVAVLVIPVFCGRASTRVIIHTEMGEIEVMVFTGQAPVTALNFLALVEQGIYTHSSFYRVVRMDNQPQNQVKIEVIQGGLYKDDLIDAHSAIQHEPTHITGIRHTSGVISMARNEPGTASTEFFICVGDQPSLDFGGDRNPDGQGFAAFGKVSRGMEVVRAIQALPDSGQYLSDPVLIKKMEIVP